MAEPGGPIALDPPWRERPNFLSLCLFVILLLTYIVPFGDLDYAWQIRLGEQIRRTGQLRPVDTLTYTIGGQLLPDFEWLYEVSVYEIWSGLGMAGLKLAKLALVALPLIVLSLHLRNQGIGWPGQAAALFVAIWVPAISWNLRALNFSTLGLLILTATLHDHCTGRKPLPWWLPLVTLLWANLHPAVIMGQALLVGAIGWECLNRFVRLNPPVAGAALGRLAVVGGAALAATFVSPDPIDRLLYPFQHSVSHPIMKIFEEMRPIYHFLSRPPYGVSLAYATALAVAYTMLCRFRQYRLWEIALFLVLAALANTAYRSLQDWILVMLLLGVPHLAALIEQCPADGRIGRARQAWQDSLRGPSLRFQWFWATAIFSLFALFSLIPPLGRLVPDKATDDFPIAATAWIDSQGLHGNFYAPPNYGAYLAWRLGDRVKVYVDTRGFFFPPEDVADGHLLPQLLDGWQERLQRVLNRGTDYFLLESSGPRGELWRYLQPRVGEPLYLDKDAVLLSADQVRRAMANPAAN